MNLWDLLIKFTGDGQSLRDDIDESEAKVDELNRKIDEAHDKNISMKVDTRSAKDHLDELKADMKELHDKKLAIFFRTQEAEDKLYEYRMQLDELSDKIVNLNLDDRDAKDKLDEIGLETDKLKANLETMLVGLEDKGAIAKIDYMMAKLNAIKENAITIHAKVDDTAAKPKFDALMAKEQEIRNALVKVDLKDEDAKIKAKELRLDLDKLHDVIVKVNIRDDGAILKLDELDLKLDGVKRRIDSINATSVKSGGGKGGFSWGTLIAGLLPTASPLAADAGGGLMGLLSAMAPGVAGGAGYAAVAGSTLMPVFAAESSLKSAEAQYQATLNNPAATNAQKLQALQAVHQSTANLNGGQMQALGQVQQFGTFMQGFDKSFQPQVLQSFTSVLQLLQNLLKDLAPAIHGFASGLNELLSGANKALGSPVWKSFFSYLGSNAKSSILAFGQGLGNLATGFASLLMAFNPLAKSMDAGWTKMTASFAHWAAGLSKSQGFQKFLDYVKQTGPLVLKLVGNLGTTIANLLTAMAPVGKLMLGWATGASGVLKVVSALLVKFPALGNTASSILPLVGAFKGLDAITKGWLGRLTGRAFKKLYEISGLKSVLTSAGKAMAGFGKSLLNAAVQATALKAKWIAMQVATAAQTVAMKAATLATKAWELAAAGASKVMPLLQLGIRGVGVAIRFMTGPWGILIAAVVAGVILIITHWKQVSTEAQKLWKDVTTYFKVIKEVVEEAIIHMVANVVKEFLKLKQNVEDAWNKMWSAVKKAVKASGLESYLKGYWDYIKGVFKTFLDLLTGHWSKAWTDMKTALKNIWNDIKNTTLGHMLTDALNWGENLVHMIGNGIMNGIHWVTNAVNAVANQVKSFLGFHSPTEEGPGSEADVWMPNLMKMLTNGIQQGTPALRAALNNALGMPTWSVSSGVAGMMIGGGNSRMTVQVEGNIVHTGRVQSDGLTRKAITEINQELNRELQRKMRT